MKRILVQNTRLFPKHRGASAYRVSGIASRCDWVILTDGADARCDMDYRGDLSRQPRTVFLSLRSFFGAIPHFVNEVLPRIEEPFVLVSGSEDVTIPRQFDSRWRESSAEERALVDHIIADERVVHWFVENRDRVLPKTSSLPVGYVFPEGGSEEIEITPNAVPLAERPLRVLCSHRVREGEQWERRRRVTALCDSRFADFASVFTDELDAAEFEAQVRRHPFVLCVQGGGFDPSPKAWLSIACGSIPIIKSSSLDDAYRALPVAFVDDWTPDALSVEQLRQWREQLAPWYEDPARRAEVLHRLSLDYWWDRVMQAQNAAVWA